MAKLEGILAAERAQQQEFFRRGECREGREVAESDSGNKVSRYAGIETGDAQLGKCSCVGTRRSERDRDKGQERVAPPKRTSGGGWKWRIRTKKHGYVKISNGS